MVRPPSYAKASEGILRQMACLSAAGRRGWWMRRIEPVTPVNEVLSHGIRESRRMGGKDGA